MCSSLFPLLTYFCTAYFPLPAAYLHANTGRKPVVGRRPTTGCAHSKITRVRILS